MSDYQDIRAAPANPFAPTEEDRHRAAMDTAISAVPGRGSMFLLGLLAAAIPAAILGAWMEHRMRMLEAALSEVGGEVRDVRRTADRSFDRAWSADIGAEKILYALARDKARTGADPAGLADLQAILPTLVLEHLAHNGQMGEVSFAEFNAERWIFVPQSVIDGLDRDVYRAFAEKMNDRKIRLVIDTP
jgi:hypothetical protein